MFPSRCCTSPTQQHAATRRRDCGWVKTDLGTQHAQLDIADGAKTSVELALLAPDGPNGKFIHAGEELPW